jgi:HEPN domain-containing protein
MNSDDLVRGWFAKAASDLRNAEIILASEPGDLPTDTVCFHCQQAVEKYLKGFLASKNREFPLTHNLSALVEEAAVADGVFSGVRAKAESLTPYAVSIRYPDDFQMPALQEAREAFAIAQEIRALVLGRVDQGDQVSH